MATEDSNNNDDERFYCPWLSFECLNTRHCATCSVNIVSFKSYNNPDASTAIISTLQMRLRKDKLLTQGLAEQDSNLGCQITLDALNPWIWNPWDSQGRLYYAILYKRLEHLWILVSAGVLEPTPHSRY